MYSVEHFQHNQGGKTYWALHRIYIKMKMITEVRKQEAKLLLSVKELLLFANKMGERVL